MQKLVQIVPRFSPAIDGIGDFARRLGQEFENRFGWDSLFVAGEGTHAADRSVSPLESRTASALSAKLATLNPDSVLLHYAGYGYDQRGIPSWIADGLEDFRSKSARSIVIFFHEIWSSGPPWKSEFYLRALQRDIVTRLVRLADHGITSAPRMQRLLSSKREALLVPIPSLIEPPAPQKKNAGEKLRLVLFGQHHTRSRTLRAHAPLIRSLDADAKLHSLVLLGKDASAVETDALGLGPGRIEVLPNADVQVVGRCLSSADALLSFYPADLITKSSSIMTAFACGCPVILPDAAGAEEFRPRPPFLACNGSTSGIAALLNAREQGRWAETAARALAWYEQHASWSAAVAKLAPLFDLPRASRREPELLARGA